jgi:hypothetical protein
MMGDGGGWKKRKRRVGVGRKRVVRKRGRVWGFDHPLVL